MPIFETLVFTGFVTFVQSIWVDTIGKIFILTFVGYSASYMIYSGYISWFAGGYGGLLLSQIGFTATDFISLLPTALVLLFESAWSLIKFLAKTIFYFIVLPAVVGFVIVELLSVLGVGAYTENTFLASLSYLAWLVTFSIWVFFVEISQSKYKKYFRQFVVVAIISMAILFLSSWNKASNSVLINIPGPEASEPIKPNFIDEIAALGNLVLFSISPFAAGRLLAPLAIERKHLSQLLALHLKEPIQMPGAVLEVKKTKISQKGSKLEQRKRNINTNAKVYSFIWNQGCPAYLIASYNRTTALYFPPETLNSSHGRLLLLNNEMIYAVEIKGHKRVDQLDLQERL